MTLLSADKAASLSASKDPAFAVEALLKLVEKAAEAGKWMVTTRDYGFGTSTYCNESEYPPLCKEILKALRTLGYNCNVCAIERQFVDLWLEISWEHKGGKRDELGN